jgi:2-keto-3-deoxy-L-rhamnonate aldolase RhmA
VVELEGLDETSEDRPVLARVLALKQKLRQGGSVAGAWISLTDPAAAEILGQVGFDFLLFDSEHSPWDLAPLQTAIMALNGTRTVPIVRVPWNDHVRIKQVLDLGAEGILAPMVNTVAECRALVSACRYPPLGTRGFGPRRASNYYRNAEAYLAVANEAIFVMPQIESIGTVEVLDDYLRVPGIDAVCIGPNDLSGTAGLLRQLEHPTVKGALDRIVETASAHKIPVCLGVNTRADQQAELVRRGVRILLVTSDLELLSTGARNALKATVSSLKHPLGAG